MIKQINISGKIIKFKYVKRIPGEPKDVLGVFEPGQRLIYIRKQDKNEMAYTILHEIFHAILWNRGLHNILTLKKEEVLCDTFANSLVDLIKNNKEILNVIEGVKDGKIK